MEDDECPGCRVLRDWIDREIQEKEYFRDVLFANTRLIQPQEAIYTPIQNERAQLQSTNRHIPFRIRKAKKEAEQRARAKGEHVDVSPDLNIAEQLFQAELEKVKS